jgi:hypothetical protein
MSSADESMATPLEPREFFCGNWVGPGERRPHPLLRWFAPFERLHLESTATWVTEATWLVKDRLEFSSGRVLEREMSCEFVRPDRIQVTADDMPGGATIHLFEDGFRFAPYYVRVDYRGFRFRLRCFDDNEIDEDGFVHDRIRMYLWPIPVATMSIGPIRRWARPSDPPMQPTSGGQV